MSADDEAARAKAVHNEQTKLSATYLNGLAIALAAVGGLTPIFSGRFAPDAVSLGLAAANTAVCLGGSGLLHFTARRLLKGMR